MLQGDGKQIFSSDINIQIGANRTVKYLKCIQIPELSKIKGPRQPDLWVVDQIQNKDSMCVVVE